MVESFRAVNGKHISLEYRYYISSKALIVDQVADTVCEHWGVNALSA